MRPLLLLLLASSLAGCAHTSEMTATRRALARAYPDARFERRVAVSAGPLTMGLARAAIGLSGDSTARALRPLLRHVRHVRVRVYDASALGVARGPVAMPARLRRDGWHPIVRVRSEGETVWVCVRERRGRLRSVFVSALSEGELVLVQADGDLTALVTQAIDFGLERRGRAVRTDTVAVE